MFMNVSAITSQFSSNPTALGNFVGANQKLGYPEGLGEKKKKTLTNPIFNPNPTACPTNGTSDYQLSWQI